MCAKSTVVDNGQDLVVFLHAKELHALSFIVKGMHSITRTKFFRRLEMPMSISTVSYNMQSYDSDNRALTVDEGTCSSDDHCIFHSSSTFLGAIIPFILQKLPQPLTCQIALTFIFPNM